MNLQEHWEAVSKFNARQDSAATNALHGICGFVSEIGELISVYKAQLMYDRAPDLVNVKEELGDCCWFLGLVRMTGGNRVIDANIDQAIQQFTSLDTEAGIEMLKKTLETPQQKIRSLLSAGWAFQPIVARSTQADNSDEMLAELVQVGVGSGSIVAGYVAVVSLASCYGWTLSDVLEGNVAKLTARYGDKFSVEKANNRDKEAEREAVGV